MKVLHFYKTYFPDSRGGLEEVIRQICLNTRDYGVESRVLAASARPGKAPFARVEATVVQGRAHVEIASCPIGTDLLRKFREQLQWADILHLHYPWPFADVVYLAAARSRSCIVTYHSDIVRQRLLRKIYAPVQKAFLGRVEKIVATSDNYLASSETLQAFRDKVQVIPIGIRQQAYPPLNQRAVARMRARFGTGFFLFAGVLRYYKGLEILLEAARGTDLPIVIVGLGALERRLHRIVRRQRIRNVHFAGYISETEKVAMYELCKAVVLPSNMRSEAYGVTLVEGAMYRRPLVSAEIETGTTFVNRHEETGLVVEAGSAASLRAALLRLATEPGLAERLGNGARERYLRLLTGESMGRRYYEVYQRMLAETATAGTELQSSA